jgi:hypothetical protein
MTISVWFSNGPCFFKCATSKHYKCIFSSFSNTAHIAIPTFHYCCNLKHCKSQDIFHSLLLIHNLLFPMTVMPCMTNVSHIPKYQVLWSRMQQLSTAPLLHFHIFILTISKWIRLQYLIPSGDNIHIHILRYTDCSFKRTQLLCCWMASL